MTEQGKLSAQSSGVGEHTTARALRAALEVAVAERQQAIDERDAARKASDTQHGLFLKVVDERDVLRQREADLTLRCEQAIDALREYADARNWAISRMEMNHPVLSWVGPGATETVPDGPQVARAALLNLGEQP